MCSCRGGWCAQFHQEFTEPEYTYPQVKLDIKLRACRNCHYLKTYSQFLMAGCDNCEHILNMRLSPETVDFFTVPDFEGIVSLTAHNRSWRAVTFYIAKFVPGPYALHIFIKNKKRA